MEIVKKYKTIPKEVKAMQYVLGEHNNVIAWLRGLHYSEPSPDFRLDANTNGIFMVNVVNGGRIHLSHKDYLVKDEKDMFKVYSKEEFLNNFQEL